MKLRSANNSDAKGITDLFEAYDLHTAGEVETTENDTKDILQAIPNLETHSWIGEVNGRITGFAGVTEGSGDTYPSLVLVHPDYHNQGIEKVLVEQMSQSISKGTITVSSNNDYENGMFSKNGFEPVRYWFNMKIDLEKAPPVDSALPPGFTIEPFQQNRDEEVTHMAFEESFETHFDYSPSTIEEFLKRTEREGFDPDLWLLLKVGEETAGFIFCKRTTEHHAEITHLGVRPGWRKKGLGKMLLQAAFHKMFSQGRPVIDLNVDSENGTGAVKVYQEAGMSINRRFIRYDKKIG